jgi:hypothetical protein
MKRTMSRATIALAGAALFGLAACQGQNSSPVPATGVSVVQIPQSHRDNGGPLAPTLAVSSCGPCYTYTNGPSSETLYAVDGVQARRSMITGVAAPWVGLVFDASGDLFVANCSTCLTGAAGTNNVVEFKPRANTPSVTITNGITYPFDLAVDSSGTLYASNLGCYSPSCSGSVSEYAAGYAGGSPTATIQVKYPLGLALDSAQNLYVANCAICSTGTAGSDQVLVYAPGSTTPTRTITTGINEPVAMVVDASNNLYVANCINCGLGAAVYVTGGTDTITECASGSSTPTKTITLSGTDIPFSLAIDRSGDLFSGNVGANSVTEYPPNAVTPSKTITKGVSAPVSLAIDAKGVLHVSNSGGSASTGTVTEYPANYRVGNPPKHTLSVTHPSSIAVSN